MNDTTLEDRLEQLDKIRRINAQIESKRREIRNLEDGLMALIQKRDYLRMTI